MHKLFALSMVAMTASAVNMQAKSQIQSQARSASEVNAMSEADFGFSSIVDIAKGAAEKAKKAAAKKARQLKRQAMRKARRAKRMAMKKAKEMEKQALKEVAAINPQAAEMLQDQLDNAEANLTDMADKAQSQMADKLSEIEERASELDPNVIGDKLAESLESNLGVDVDSVMDKVNEVQDLAESQLGTLDPDELMAMAQAKADETGIIDKLKDPSSLTMDDLLEVQQQAQSVDVDALKEQALDKKDEIADAVEQLELAKTLESVKDTASNVSLDDLTAVKDDMVEATGTEDLVADLVEAVQEQKENAETLYNENDGEKYLDLLKEKASEVDLDDVKDTVADQAADLADELNLDQNSALLQQVAGQVMDNGDDLVSGASDVAQRIMDGEDPTQVALEVALENKDALESASQNETLQSVLDSVVTEDQKEQLKNDAMEAIMKNPEKLVELVTDA